MGGSRLLCKMKTFNRDLLAPLFRIKSRTQCMARLLNLECVYPVKSRNSTFLPRLDLGSRIMFPGLLFATSVPSCLSVCLLLGALQSTTQGRRDQRQGAF